MKIPAVLGAAFEIARDALGDAVSAAREASMSDVLSTVRDATVNAALFLATPRGMGRVAGAVLSAGSVLTLGKGAVVSATLRSAIRLGARGLGHAATRWAPRVTDALGGGRLARLAGSGLERGAGALSRGLRNFDAGIADADRVMTGGLNNALLAGVETAFGSVLRGKSVRETIRETRKAAVGETVYKRFYDAARHRAGQIRRGVPREARRTARRARIAPARAARAARRATAKAKALPRETRQAIATRRTQIQRDIKVRQRALRLAQRRYAKMSRGQRAATVARGTARVARRPLRTLAKGTARVGIAGLRVGTEMVGAIAKIAGMAALTAIDTQQSTAALRPAHIGRDARRLALALKGEAQPAAGRSAEHGTNRAPSPSARAAFWKHYRAPGRGQAAVAREPAPAPQPVRAPQHAPAAPPRSRRGRGRER